MSFDVDTDVAEHLIATTSESDDMDYDPVGEESDTHDEELEEEDDDDDDDEDEDEDDEEAISFEHIHRLLVVGEEDDEGS
jgi:hypothetical protein